MNSENLLKISSDLKELLKNKEIIDIILFGSFVKGKESYGDIDIAILSEKDIQFKKEGYHVSNLKPVDFFVEVPTLVNTLIREGFSLREKKSFSEIWRFNAGCLFNYELNGLSNSQKVMTVRTLRGNASEKGMVEKFGGKWLSNNVFICPIHREYVFQKFFENKSIKFNKSFILMH